MKLINQTLLSLLTILIFGVSLFFSMSQASGQSEDKNKIQNEVRARLVFDVAKGFFIVENYKSAIDRLEEFSKLYPDSPLTVEAILLENQARFKLGQFEGVVAELNTSLPVAGAWADRYLFWIGEAHFALGHFTEATDVYGSLIENYFKIINNEKNDSIKIIEYEKIMDHTNDILNRYISEIEYYSSFSNLNNSSDLL